MWSWKEDVVGGRVGGSVHGSCTLGILLARCSLGSTEQVGECIVILHAVRN